MNMMTMLAIWTRTSVVNGQDMDTHKTSCFPSCFQRPGRICLGERTDIAAAGERNINSHRLDERNINRYRTSCACVSRHVFAYALLSRQRYRPKNFYAFPKIPTRQKSARPAHRYSRNRNTTPTPQLEPSVPLVEPSAAVPCSCPARGTLRRRPVPGLPGKKFT